MAIFRVEKNKNYTTLSNYHFKEKEMSLKAKGLLSVMLSLPESWDYTIQGLVAICKENESAIKSTLKELSDFGYLEIVKLFPDQTDSGRIEYIYNIYEYPKQEGKKQGVENQPLEFLGVEVQPVENQGQLNTNNKITKELNTNELITDYELDTIEENPKQTEEGLDELYVRLCPNLTPYQPGNYQNEINGLLKALHTKEIKWDDIKKAFVIANKSPFLQGKVKNWKADFKWIIKPVNILKILDGKYDDTKPKKQDIMKHNYDFDAIRKRNKEIWHDK